MVATLRFVGAVVLMGLLTAAPIDAQSREAPSDTVEAWHQEAWTEIVRRKGVSISYLFYPEADNEHNGVVLRLRNHNDHPVRYAFSVIFRAPEADSSATVRGHLGPGEMKTGDEAGLFWIPFREDEYHIGEIGLSGLEFRPRPNPQ